MREREQINTNNNINIHTDIFTRKLMIDVNAMNNEPSINCEKMHVKMNCDQ